MRISDWSSDVCSSDLIPVVEVRALADRRTAGVFEEVLRLHNRAGRGILQNATVGVLAKLEELELLLGKARQSLHGKRSEERRVGKECVSTFRSRWSPFY